MFKWKVPSGGHKPPPSKPIPPPPTTSAPPPPLLPPPNNNMFNNRQQPEEEDIYIPMMGNPDRLKKAIGGEPPSNNLHKAIVSPNGIRKTSIPAGASPLRTVPIGSGVPDGHGRRLPDQPRHVLTGVPPIYTNSGMPALPGRGVVAMPSPHGANTVSVNSVLPQPSNLKLGRSGLERSMPRTSAAVTRNGSAFVKSVNMRNGGGTSGAGESPKLRVRDHRPNNAKSNSWNEWTQQLQGYVSWINWQLKKKPGIRLVSDLRMDLQTGVAVASLIEILGGEPILGIDLNPVTRQSRRDNFARILQFLSAQDVSVDGGNIAELADGNLRALTRLIHALARKYKPQSVAKGNNKMNGILNTSSSDSSTSRKSTSQSLHRAASLSSGSWAVTSGQQQQQHYRKPIKKPPDIGGNGPVLEPDQCYPTNNNSLGRIRRNGPLRSSGPPAYRSPPGARKTVEEPPRLDPPIYENLRNGSPDEDSGPSSLPPLISPKRNGGPTALAFWEKLQNKRGGRELKYHTIHRMSLKRRQLPDAPEDRPMSRMDDIPPPLPASQPPSLTPIPDKGSSSDEDQANSKTSKDSTDDTSKITREADGASSGHEGDTLSSIPDLNSSGSHEGDGGEPQCREIDGASSSGSPATSVVQGPVTNHMSLAKLVDWRSQPRNDETFEALLQEMENTRKQLLELHALECITLEGSRRGLAERLSQQEQTALKASLSTHVLIQEKDTLVRTLKVQEDEIRQRDEEIRQLKRKLGVTSTESRGVLALPAPPIMNGGGPLHSTMQSPPREELKVVRDALTSLRKHFRPQDCNHHTLDTLEQAVQVLTERLHCLEMNGEKPNHVYRGSPCEGTTRLVYFTPRSVTPFVTAISKPIGDVTLRDFKAVTLTSFRSNIRFLFRSYDPEFGAVKEEIHNEDTRLPGADGKIIAWIEDEPG